MHFIHKALRDRKAATTPAEAAATAIITHVFADPGRYRDRTTKSQPTGTPTTARMEPIIGLFIGLFESRTIRYLSFRRGSSYSIGYRSISAISWVAWPRVVQRRPISQRWCPYLEQWPHWWLLLCIGRLSPVDCLHFEVLSPALCRYCARPSSLGLEWATGSQFRARTPFAWRNLDSPSRSLGLAKYNAELRPTCYQIRSAIRGMPS